MPHTHSSMPNPFWQHTMPLCPIIPRSLAFRIGETYRLPQQILSQSHPKSTQPLPPVNAPTPHFSSPALLSGNDNGDTPTDKRCRPQRSAVRSRLSFPRRKSVKIFGPPQTPSREGENGRATSFNLIGSNGQSAAPGVRVQMMSTTRPPPHPCL